MHLFRASLNSFSIVLLAQFAPLAFSTPIGVSVVNLENQAGIEKPAVDAEKSFERSTVTTNLLNPRTPPGFQRLTVTGTQTSLLVHTIAAVSSGSLAPLLEGAFDGVCQNIDATGDGPLISGEYIYQASGFILRVYNANNHQLTRGVLGVALAALRGYVEQQGSWVMDFKVFDGVNQVAVGKIT